MSGRDSAAKLDAVCVVTEPRFGGADPTGVADSTAAIQAAIDYIAGTNPNRGGVVRLPRGTYRTTAPLTITQRGVTLRGEGNIAEGETIAGATQIIADHNDGAVIRVSVADTRIESLTIAASDARYAGSAGTTAVPCCGLHFEGPDVDTGAAALQRTRLRDVTVIHQPSHGILFVAAQESTTLLDCFTQYNLGHGLVFDRGTITGRTNSRPPGIVTILNLRTQDNGGHGLAIGNPDTTNLPAYRVFVVNMESIRNGADQTLVYEPYGTFAYGHNIEFHSCAFGARPTGATIGDPWTGGLAIAGRCHRVVNCRYINNDQPAKVFNYETEGEPSRDIEFDGMHISSAGATPFAVAVEVEAGCEQVRVKAYSDARETNAQYTEPVSKDFEGYWSEESKGIDADQKVTFRDFSSSPQITLADDTVQVLEFSGATGGILVLSQQNDSGSHAMLAFRVAATGAYITSMVSGADVVTGTGVLTDGTSDGTNAKFNVFVDDAGAFKLYLKNRMGGERQFRVTLLGVTAPQYALSTTF